MTARLLTPQPAADADRLAALDRYRVRDLSREAGLDGVVMLARTLCAAPRRLD